MAFKITIDKQKCIGCGACAAVCSENFELKNGKANVKKAAVDEIGCNQEAADGCPVQCISIKKE